MRSRWTGNNPALLSVNESACQKRLGSWFRNLESHLNKKTLFLTSTPTTFRDHLQLFHYSSGCDHLNKKIYDRSSLQSYFWVILIRHLPLPSPSFWRFGIETLVKVKIFAIKIIISFSFLQVLKTSPQRHVGSVI